ncbi:MAG: hypothetical protein Q9166_001154 [cf. Caloplaca sp. 2 TL-2023]
MLIDDDDLIDSPHSARRHRLEQLITSIRGRSRTSKQKIVDFSSPGGPEKLRALFANALAQRWEGLVLKPSDEPYFYTRRTSSDAPARGWIKLKKDYIPGLGDTADFAVVGAGYDASRFAQLQCPNLKWTHFHLGCLRNKKEVKAKNAKPAFRIVTTLEVNADMAKHLNLHGQFCAVEFGSLKSRMDPFQIDISKGMQSMNIVFRKPFVVDVVGAGFDKDSNRNYYTLRFPRALKIHNDRDWKDTVSFDELQKMAKIAMKIPDDQKAEVAMWERELDQVDRGAKGSYVPWDLSDDDVDLPDEVLSAKPVANSASRTSRRRSSVAPPMIRMDTHEMTTKEQRLNTGEVVQRPSQRSPTSNWSESNLPTPPKSSPAREITPIRGRPALASIRKSQSTDQSSTPYSRQGQASIESANSTNQSRKRSSDDAQDTQETITPKRQRVSPPVRQTKKDEAGSRQVANTKPPQEAHKANQICTPEPSLLPKLPVDTAKEAQKAHQAPPSEPFLVPKLSTGAAEAVRTRKQPRIIRGMEQTSQERQTSADERSSQDVHSTQQSLVEEWNLQRAESQPSVRVHIPDLLDSHVVLSPDVSVTPYLTFDLLSREGIRFQQAHEVFEEGRYSAKLRPRPGAEGNTAEVVVLVECRRHARGDDKSLELLKYLIGRVPADQSQILWVFDWRLVEDIYARGADDEERLLAKRLIGRFWYEDDGELRWLSRWKQLRIVPRERIEESRAMDGSCLHLSEVERERLIRALGL